MSLYMFSNRCLMLSDRCGFPVCFPCLFLCSSCCTGFLFLRRVVSGLPALYTGSSSTITRNHSLHQSTVTRDHHWIKAPAPVAHRGPCVTVPSAFVSARLSRCARPSVLCVLTICVFSNKERFCIYILFCHPLQNDLTILWM